MGFTSKIKEDILVASARHCCVCHRYKGLKIEIHHITPKEQGGKDSYENGIALCFDCHCDAGHYFAKHPKGTKVSPTELHKHKTEWFENVKRNNISIPLDLKAELVIDSDETNLIFKPIFIEETTIYKNKNELKKLNYKKFVEDMKTGNVFFDHFYNKINSFDDFVSHMNGEDIEKYIKDDTEQHNNPQPVNFSMGYRGTAMIKNINLSICVLPLKVINKGSEALENFKVYLNFEDIINADVVSKRKDFFDMNEYEYHVTFKDKLSAEYYPKVSTLVQTDFVELDKICIKSKPIKQKGILNWRIVARDFQNQGKIELDIIPILEKQERVKYVDNPENYVSFTQVKNKFKYE